MLLGVSVMDVVDGMDNMDDMDTMDNVDPTRGGSNNVDILN